MERAARRDTDMFTEHTNPNQRRLGVGHFVALATAR
jgi:hypothetical protein